jgi:hypothetical protein
MTSVADLTMPYSEGPNTTTIGSIVMSGSATNVCIVMVAMTDDITTSPAQLVNATYLLTWDGTIIDTVTKEAGIASSVFAWTTSGNTATFSITPNSNSPAGNAIIHMVVIPNSSNIAIFF